MECAGIADRAAFDLKAHMDKSKVPMVAHARLDKPVRLFVVLSCRVFD